MKKDNTQHLAEVLKDLKGIGGDLEFLHNILYEDQGPNDSFRKVQLATPYLETKVDLINNLLEDYSKHLPDELREKLHLERQN